MGVFVKGAVARRDAVAWTAGGGFAAEGIRGCGLTFHALGDGRGGGVLAHVALPGSWRAGRARLERDRVAGGPYILAFSATGPFGEELIYRSEIRSPQAAASARLRGVGSPGDRRRFLAASCDRLAAQFAIRLSGAAELVDERIDGDCDRAGFEADVGGDGGETEGVVPEGCIRVRLDRLSGMRTYELNDGATTPLMLAVALSAEKAGAGGDTATGRWRAVDCFCLVTPHDRFERVIATALAAARATLRIDAATARLLGRQDAGTGGRRSA